MIYRDHCHPAAKLIVFIPAVVVAVVTVDLVQRLIQFDDNKLVIVRPKRADVAAGDLSSCRD